MDSITCKLDIKRVPARGHVNWHNIPVFGRNPALDKDSGLKSRRGQSTGLCGQRQPVTFEKLHPLLSLLGILWVVPFRTGNMTKLCLFRSSSRNARSQTARMFLPAVALSLTLAGLTGNPKFAQAHTATPAKR